jgi:hypothetical protein
MKQMTPIRKVKTILICVICVICGQNLSRIITDPISAYSSKHQNSFGSAAGRG